MLGHSAISQNAISGTPSGLLASVGAARRYWRLLISENNGSGNTSVAELVLRDASGADVATGGTATDSGNIGAGYVGAKAFDKDLNSMWNIGVAEFGDRWVQYDFGGSPKAIASYTVRARPESLYVADTPRAWALQYSDDGATWAIAHAVSGQTGWAGGEARTYSVPADNGFPKWWRVNVTNTFNGSAITMAAAGMRESVGGAEIALPPNGRAMTSASVSSSYPPRNLIDGSAASIWNNSGLPCSWRMEFGRGRDVREYTLTARNDGFVNDSPKDWTLDYSYDGVTWVTADARAGVAAWSLGETRTFTVANPAVPPTPPASSSGKRKPRPWQTGSRMGNSFKRPS